MRNKASTIVPLLMCAGFTGYCLDARAQSGAVLMGTFTG